MEAQDSRWPHELSYIHLDKCMPMSVAQNMNQKEILGFIYCMLREMELHEIDEWFKLDGYHVKDPHPEFRKK